MPTYIVTANVPDGGHLPGMTTVVTPTGVVHARSVTADYTSEMLQDDYALELILKMFPGTKSRVLGDRLVLDTRQAGLTSDPKGCVRVWVVDTDGWSLT